MNLEDKFAWEGVSCPPVLMGPAFPQARVTCHSRPQKGQRGPGGSELWLHSLLDTALSRKKDGLRNQKQLWKGQHDFQFLGAQLCTWSPGKGINQCMLFENLEEWNSTR